MDVSQMQQAMGAASPPTAPTTSGRMTVQQMQQIMNGGATHQLQAAGLGQTTGWLSNFLGAASNVASNVAAGAGGQINQTLTNISSPLTGMVDKMIPAPQLDRATAQLKGETQKMQTDTTSGKIGSLAANVGEFFVPGGSEEAVGAKVGEYIDKLPEAVGLSEKAAPFITASLKTALKGITTAGSMGAVTAAQTGGDVSQIKKNAELGGILGVASGALDTFGPMISQALNKADFRMTPTGEAKAGKIADNASKFITTNGITGTNPTKFVKLKSIIGQMEKAIQESLPKGLTVPTKGIIEEAKAFVENLRQEDPAVYDSAKTQLSKGVKLLQEHGENMDVADVLKAKRSWGDLAFKLSKGSKADPTVSHEGAYALEQAFQKNLDVSLYNADAPIKIPGGLQKYFNGATEMPLSDFNKTYADAINARNLTGIAQFRNDAGLFGRLFGLWTGRTIGSALFPGLGGELGGAAFGEIASSHLPGGIRNISERALQHTQFPVTGAKLMGGLTTPPEGQPPQSQ